MKKVMSGPYKMLPTLLLISEQIWVQNAKLYQFMIYYLTNSIHQQQVTFMRKCMLVSSLLASMWNVLVAVGFCMSQRKRKS